MLDPLPIEGPGRVPRRARYQPTKIPARSGVGRIVRLPVRQRSPRVAEPQPRGSPSAAQAAACAAVAGVRGCRRSARLSPECAALARLRG